MDMSSLFPPEGVGGLTAPTAPHVSFRAGILTREVSTNRVTADPRRGTLQITTSPDDGLMHLLWRPRNPPTVEQDLILFNGETEMKQVTSCPSAARVYVLKWKGTDTRLFFWLQGRDASRDASNIAAVNAILENGPDAQQSVPVQATDRPATPAPSAPDADVQMQTPDAPQRAQTGALDIGAGGDASAEHQAAMEQLRQAMASFRGNQEDQQRELLMRIPTLPDLLNMDLLAPILEKPHVQGMIGHLMEDLPEQDRSISGIKETLRSPPVKSQAQAIYRAMHSGGAEGILRSFGLPVEDSFVPYGPKMMLESLSKHQRDKRDAP